LTKQNDRYGMTPIQSWGVDVRSDGDNSAITRRAFLQASGMLAMTPALAHADATAADVEAARHFDFLHGQWNVVHRKLKQRLAGSKEWTEFQVL
jgi:hypothetical protein